jgi:hypothetical protein
MPKSICAGQVAGEYMDIPRTRHTEIFTALVAGASDRSRISAPNGTAVLIPDKLARNSMGI